MVGLIACYFNKEEAFISNVSVLPEYAGQGIASKLMTNCINNANKKKAPKIRLEVSSDSTQAIQLYKKYGFRIRQRNTKSLIMELDLLESYQRS